MIQAGISRLALRSASLLRGQFSLSSFAVLNVMSGIGRVIDTYTKVVRQALFSQEADHGR
jgi:hypothetical protein